MTLPIIGIRLRSKKFIPLITAQGQVKAPVQVYKNDFVNKEIPIYVCKMENPKKVEKVYKIGRIAVADKYFEKLVEDQNDGSGDKYVLSVESELQDGKNIAIRVIAENQNEKIPLKEYTADILDELDERVAEEREEFLLDYGNFVKCKKQTGFLLPERDLTEEGQVLTETENEEIVDESKVVEQPVEKVKKNKKDDFDDAVRGGIKTRGSLAAKINSLFVFFVIFGMCAIIAGIGYFIYKDANRKLKNNCAEKSRAAATSIARKLDSLSGSALFLDTIYSDAKNKDVVVGNFFKNNPDVALIALSENDFRVNEDFIIKQGNDEKKLIAAYKECNSLSGTDKLNNGKKVVNNISHNAKIRTAALRIPVLESKTNQYRIITVIFSTSDLEAVCTNTDDYGIDFCEENGNLIAGLSYEWVMQCRNLCDFKNKITAVETIPEYSCSVSAFAKTVGYDKYVIDTLVKMAYVAAAVITILLIFMAIFADGLVRPINKMRLAIEKVMNDDYNINIKSRRHDELGALVNSFGKMCQSFMGRDSYRKTFGTTTTENIYHSEQNGNINLKGETRITTVLISEIRDFEKITESLTASEVIKLLNEYVSEMERCITATGGFINKINGNKIFAAWGAPLSSGTPKADAVNAIKSAFRMKYALVDFNSDRGTAAKPAIKVGLGLHTGATVSGQVGSGEITEYTCVGGSVTTAMEIENYTKSFGCDILISEDTYLLVSDIVEAQKITDVAIKGQKEALTLYAVSKLKN
ncbi:MAG: adenylate/guanylate cyclase domain-containing protein [Treponema sp.]|nr:adenylate/guanylate cyclase domain-containing protein [Candidatus Treponema scatequi]